MDYLVAWSGGCDSTLMLANLLSDGNKRVRTVSFNFRQMGGNVQARGARKVLKKKLEKRYGKFESHEICWDSRTMQGIHAPYGGAQPLFWSFIGSLYIDINQMFALGYISKDCVWDEWDNFKTMFQRQIRMLGKEKGVVLHTPLRYFEKPEVLVGLKKLGLYEDCWYCERTDLVEEPCGECVSCKTHLTAILQLRTDLSKVSPRFPRIRNTRWGTLRNPRVEEELLTIPLKRDEDEGEVELECDD